LVLQKQVPRFDRHFELHPLSWFENRVGDEYLPWLKSIRDKPVYLQKLTPDIPAGVEYPVQEILEAFGPYRYYTNTVSWMIAFAIREGVKRLGLYGIDMATEKEYKAQRPSVEYFIGWAQGAGIDVIIPPPSDLLKSSLLYGFQADAGLMREKHVSRNNELQTRIGRRTEKMEQHRREAKQAELEVAFLQGALESNEYHRQWLPEPWT
jgi:hypothetical protein